MEEDMDEGQTQKGKNAFLCMFGKVNLTRLYCERVKGASAETIAQMLAFRFLNGRAAGCGDSFVHRESALHRRACASINIIWVVWGVWTATAKEGSLFGW